MALDTTNFLNLWQVFRSELVGDFWLFIFLCLIAVLYFANRNNMGWQLSIMSVTLMSMMFYSIAYDQYAILGTFIVLFVFAFTGYQIARAFHRGS